VVTHLTVQRKSPVSNMFCFSLAIQFLHNCFCVFNEGMSHQQPKSINVIYFVLSVLRFLDLKFMSHSRSTDHF